MVCNIWIGYRHQPPEGIRTRKLKIPEFRVRILQGVRNRSPTSWRMERMSRSFSGCLRHDPRHGVHKECQRQVDMGPDGSVELYDALTCITHARNFIGNKPGLLLMAMFPSYGKSRFEIAFVFPSVDGSYNERKARGEIVPRNPWIDKLTTRSAQNALRPDGKEFYNNPEMEFYVRCNSGHTRQVEIQSFGRPCTLSSRESLNTTNRTMIPQRNPFHQVRFRQDPRRLMKMKAQLSPSTECEGRHHHPLKKREKSSRSRRSPSRSCSMQPMERAQIWEIPVKPFGENTRPHGMHR